MTGIYAVIMTYIMQVKMKMESFLKKEDGEVNIIAIIVLIGIAILLALIFKDRLGLLINDLFDTLDNSAQNAIKK